MLVLAHRGTGPGVEENKLTSFITGLNGGADGIELDIRVTRDNVVICSHDDSLSRVYGIDSNVSSLSLAELKEMSLVGDSSMVTLEDVFKNLGNEIYYNIEIKAPEAVSGLAALIKKYEIKDFMVSTFKHDCLAIASELIPNLNTATLIHFKDVINYREYMEDILEKYNPYAVNLDIRYFYEATAEKVDYFNHLRENGLKLSFWTVNEVSQFILVKDICDYLITDKPELFMEYVNR